AAELSRPAEVAEELAQREGDRAGVFGRDGATCFAHQLPRSSIAPGDDRHTARHCLEHAAAAAVVPLAQPDRDVESAISLHEPRPAKVPDEDGAREPELARECPERRLLLSAPDDHEPCLRHFTLDV